MEYVEIPQIPKHSNPRPWLFLGGGITGCREWQKEVAGALEEYPYGTILNPRRAFWDMNDDSIGEEQVRMEHSNIFQADIFSIWFSSETVQPICMFELGVALTRFRMNDQRLKALVIGVDPDYERKFDVDLQTELALKGCSQRQHQRVWMCHNFDQHIENLKLALAAVYKDCGYGKTC
jgi:hypothetical protein